MKLETDTIDLSEYLTKSQMDKIANLYRICMWPFFPPDAWKWPFEFVTALYFRARAHADHFHHDDEMLASIERAITDYLSDEFS